MIIDCFTFFNELDLLEVRLHTLAPFVDAFILCEANRTFQGKEKPFVYEGGLRFECGKPIISVQVDLSFMDGVQSAWERERAQRESIKLGFHAAGYAVSGIHEDELRPSDRLILSDVDEFPDLRIFETFSPGNETIIAWHQNLYYYWVNMLCWDWIGPVSCTVGAFSDLFDGDFQLLRDARGKAECMVDGGWHFSFLGGPQAIREKIQAFSHTEYKAFASSDRIQWALTDGWKKNRDLFGRNMMQFQLMPDDSHLPPYLVQNKERFKSWWFEGE